MKHRFAEFEFDTVSGELRKNGDVVRLQSQPAQLLALLLEHAGEVVTRETLRDAVWGQDRFVEFDKGLNFAIAQVRAALGDSAESPRFIKTYPKRGYQFIALAADPPKDERDDPIVGRLRLQPDLRLVAVIVAIVAVAAVWLWSARTSATAARTIAVLRFDNQTGLAEYDRYAQNVTDAVVAELTTAGVGRFDIIGNAAVLRLPREQRDVIQIGRSLNARYIVFGQVFRDGARIRVLAHLIRVPEQTHLWVTRVEAPPGDQTTQPSDIARRVSTEFLSKL
jgi:DNA-binding winged helix-turn-helix (wHTH) protein/TolB-like protein